jgi:O6-methylguanine-DNA--protein-cysteine methyltransferase
MFQLRFNLNRIHDSVWKALRTANQGRVTTLMQLMHSQSHPRFIRA